MVAAHGPGVELNTHGQTIFSVDYTGAHSASDHPDYAFQMKLPVKCVTPTPLLHQHAQMFFNNHSTHKKIVWYTCTLNSIQAMSVRKCVKKVMWLSVTRQSRDNHVICWIGHVREVWVYVRRVC